MAKKKAKKELHEKHKVLSVKHLAAISVEEGCLISKEEALKTKWFDESYLDDEVWDSSWENIVKSMQSIYPETRSLKPKIKAAPKATRASSGGKDGKSI